MHTFLATFRAFLQGAWRRLPVETVTVLSTLAASIAVVHGGKDLWLGRIALAALVATPLAFALHGRDRRLVVGGGLAFFALALVALRLAVAVESDLDREAFPWTYGLSLAAAVLVPFVVAAPRFTGFVRRFFEEITTWSLLGGAALAALGVVGGAIATLFEVDVWRLVADACLVIVAVVVLVVLDRLLPGQESTGRMPQLWRKLAAGIGAPFVAVMLAILVVYEVMVLASGELPKNMLSPLILGAGFVGFLCTLILAAVEAEPSASGPLQPAEPHLFVRRHSVRLVRAFPAVLLVLLPMAAWALAVRIDQYGLTPFRVVRIGSLACLGLLGILGTARWLRGRPPLSWQVPATVAAFALGLAFGPLSAVNVSIRSQQARLVAAMARLGVSSQVPASVPPQVREVPAEAVATLDDALTAVARLGGESALRDVLEGDVAVCAERWIGSAACLERMGLRPASAKPTGFHAVVPSGVELRDGATVFRFVDVGTSVSSSGLLIVGDRLVLDGIASASLVPWVEAARQPAELPSEPLRLVDPAGNVVARFYVQRLEGDEQQVTYLAGALLR